MGLINFAGLEPENSKTFDLLSENIQTFLSSSLLPILSQVLKSSTNKSNSSSLKENIAETLYIGLHNVMAFLLLYFTYSIFLNT